jgi:CheY-like chemotaxis protein
MENACAQGTATVPRKSAKILQVENNSLNRNRLSGRLLHEDSEVIFAADCRPELALVSQDSCTELLVGQGIPGSDRLDVTGNPPQKHISDELPVIPILSTATNQGSCRVNLQVAETARRIIRRSARIDSTVAADVAMCNAVTCLNRRTD